jgi:hypothetical protein
MLHEPLGPPSAEADFQSNLLYLRNVYANIFEWYKIADAKAQLLLTLDGVFITVVTTTSLAKPEEIRQRINSAGALSGTFAALSAFLVALSVTSALTCLRSRLSNTRRIHRDLGIKPSDPSTYSPSIALWYGLIGSVAKASDAAWKADPTIRSELSHLNLPTSGT